MRSDQARLVSLLRVLLLSSLPLVDGFQWVSAPYRNNLATTIAESSRRFVKEERYHCRRFLDSNARARTSTTTSLRMVAYQQDPDALLQLVEDLVTEEFTPETMAKMEEIEIALATFLEETNAALLEQEGQPKPPSIPPPSDLLGMESSENDESEWQGLHWQQDRDLAADLAHAGTALELLQQRLLLEQELLLEAEQSLQQQEETYEEEKEEPGSGFDEQDILFQAEEALRKSREAAEKRRLEAEQRSMDAARISAGYRQQQIQEQALEEEQPETKPFGGVNPFGEENNKPRQNPQGGESNHLPRTKTRPTMELGSLFGKGGSDVPFQQETESRAPEGVPTLYNWVQDESGIITGNIRGSINFRDGAKISTSSVSEGARGGITVATRSGSRYYLAEATAPTDDFGEEMYQGDAGLESTITEAPDGVPTVKSWEVRNDGSIIGLIYGSPYADDGDYVETSPIVEGEIDNFSVVSTLSGSRYFLSGDPPEDSLDTLSNFQNEPIPSRRTITLPKISLPKSARRTFSLLDLFGDKDDPTTTNNNNNNNNRPANSNVREDPPWPLPPPSLDKVPPEGTPSLTGCVFNDDGSITGYVFGSPKIGDGVLITTSPIVAGEREQFETVTTASGSLYFLG